MTTMATSSNKLSKMKGYMSLCLRSNRCPSTSVSNSCMFLSGVTGGAPRLLERAASKTEWESGRRSPRPQCDGERRLLVVAVLARGVQLLEG